MQIGEFKEKFLAFLSAWTKKDPIYQVLLLRGSFSCFPGLEGRYILRFYGSIKLNSSILIITTGHVCLSNFSLAAFPEPLMSRAIRLNAF